MLSRLKYLVVVSTLTLLSTCQVDPYVLIDSANQNSRVNMLVIHATSENFAESLRLLSTPTVNPVSSHYLVPAEHDETYPSKKLRVYSLVPEHRRAWHAGVSQWANATGLNDRSIGIEVVNEFKCSGATRDEALTSPNQLDCQFPEYTNAQIDLLIVLVKDILDRHPEIEPINIVGHSDIAPLRKSDPGPNFPWQRLYMEGIGAWPEQEDIDYFTQLFSTQLPSIRSIQRALAVMGYGVDVDGEISPGFEFALRAFQLHFRAENYTAEIDLETVAILWALIKKYRAKEAQEYGSELIFG